MIEDGASEESEVADPTRGGISRRRVLAGAAWAAPAILIATAAPAAAGSAPVAGRVLLVPSSLAASMVESVFRVTGAIAYADGDPASPDADVTNVVMEVTFPADRVSPGFVDVTTAGWTYVPPVDPPVAGTPVTFTFAWSGALSTNGVTAPLEASIPKSVSLEPASVTFTARGDSGAPNLPSSDSATIPVVVGANLTLNSGPAAIRYQQAEGIDVFQYAFDGTTRWAGPYYPIGSTATGITVTARIPVAKSTGDLIEQFIGTRLDPAIRSGRWFVWLVEVVYTYVPDLTSAFQITSTLQFALKSLEGATDIATLRTEGIAAGCAAYEQRLGPSNLDYVSANWDRDPATLGRRVGQPRRGSRCRGIDPASTAPARTHRDRR